MPKIISERCELVKLCHINRNSQVFETDCSDDIVEIIIFTALKRVNKNVTRRSAVHKILSYFGNERLVFAVRCYA